MSVITISRGAYSLGKEVAEKVAQRLGYECIAREVLLEASEHFNIPEAKLLMTMENAPSILDRFTYGREKYIAYIQAAILMHFQKDNVVYHGMAGHFFVKGVPHVLKVRIIADLEDRARIVMERDGVSKKEALRSIKKLDEERRKWSRHLYGIDTWGSLPLRPHTPYQEVHGKRCRGDYLSQRWLETISNHGRVSGGDG